MKKIVLGCVLLLTIVSAGNNQDAENYNVAVVDMKVSGGIPETYALAFTDRLRHELFNTGVFAVMERSEMDEILTEQGFQLSGCTTDQCYIEAGRILNVDHIVAGSVCQIGSLYSINLRLISVETSKTEKSVAVDYQGEVEQVLASQMKEAALELAGRERGGKRKIPFNFDTSSNISEIVPEMTFVIIPAGSFQMGSNDGDSDEKPVHNVNVESFLLMTSEMTQAQWKSVMKKNPSFFKGDNLPVEQVSWYDCKEFIKQLNSVDPGKNYRLPTESEWEYACRAGSTSKYCNGDNETNLDLVGWVFFNSGMEPHKGGKKQSNEWGIFDMHGNVWEWCEDWYSENYISGNTKVNPPSPYKVLRGGSWFENQENCRCANRSSRKPERKSNDIGFRLARDL